jgi:hypothetical protein
MTRGGRCWSIYVARRWKSCNVAHNEKSPTSVARSVGLLSITSLTITYFHTGCSTIIGAESFHGPVRDGKGWDRLAMVIKH